MNRFAPGISAVALAFSTALFGQTPPAMNSVIGPRPGYEASKRLFDSWKEPVPPRRLIGNIYYVGASGVSSFLITTPEGHFLIDTGFEDTVPIIQRGVAELGFKLSDIKFILSSHAHSDHVAGHAAMKKLTRAKIVASAADARVLKSGGADDFSPFPPELMRYQPQKTDRIVRDRETVTLGGVTLTAHLTPGHTKGATTWTMNVTETGKTYLVGFFSSVSLVESTPLLHNRAYPEIVADYERTFTRLKSLPCEVWFAPHAGQFAMPEKFARLDAPDASEKPNPFIDPEGWRARIAAGETHFREQLAAEKAAGDH
jgi:metallo-beta-lactamase class B